MSLTEEIIAKDFEIVRKGYDRDEVKTFLRSIVEHVTRLEGDLERARDELTLADQRPASAEEHAVDTPAPAAAPDPEPAAGEEDSDDDFARLGSRVAAVLQSAEQNAAEITTEARTEAGDLRREADEYDTSTRSEADEYSRRTRADADAYAEMVGLEAENKARDRVEMILTEASETRRTAETTRTEVAERLRTAAEDVRLTLEAFEAGTDGSGADAAADADLVFDEVREAAAVFAPGRAPVPADGNGHGHATGSDGPPTASATDIWG